jgi:hypothetical protein
MLNASANRCGSGRDGVGERVVLDEEHLESTLDVG